MSQEQQSSAFIRRHLTLGAQFKLCNYKNNSLQEKKKMQWFNFLIHLSHKMAPMSHLSKSLSKEKSSPNTRAAWAAPWTAPVGFLSPNGSKEPTSTIHHLKITQKYLLYIWTLHPLPEIWCWQYQTVAGTGTWSVSVYHIKSQKCKHCTVYSILFCTNFITYGNLKQKHLVIKHFEIINLKNGLSQRHY